MIKYQSCNLKIHLIIYIMNYIIKLEIWGVPLEFPNFKWQQKYLDIFSFSQAGSADRTGPRMPPAINHSLFRSSPSKSHSLAAKQRRVPRRRTPCDITCIRGSIFRFFHRNLYNLLKLFYYFPNYLFFVGTFCSSYKLCRVLLSIHWLKYSDVWFGSNFNSAASFCLISKQVPKFS